MGKPGFPIPTPGRRVWKGYALPGRMFIPSACGAAAWMAEVTIARRVQPPSQPPPAGGEAPGARPRRGRVREGASTVPVEPWRGRAARAPRPWASGGVRPAHGI